MQYKDGGTSNVETEKHDLSLCDKRDFTLFNPSEHTALCIRAFFLVFFAFPSFGELYTLSYDDDTASGQ